MARAAARRGRRGQRRGWGAASRAVWARQACVIILSSSAITACGCASRSSKSEGSRMHPILIASEMPSTSSLRPSVASRSMSAYLVVRRDINIFGASWDELSKPPHASKPLR